MKRETIAIHSGYDIDPTTKAVAVPIYQTVAYAFDSTEHAAALFNLEAEGFRYTRIQNPTTAVLERRVAALEGGREALCVSSGQAAVTYAAGYLSWIKTPTLQCSVCERPPLPYTHNKVPTRGRTVAISREYSYTYKTRDYN